MPVGFSFGDVIKELGKDGILTVTREARPPSSYVLETLLPERTMPDYSVSSGGMVVRSTAAGLVGTSSPFPPVGAMSISSFLEQVAGIAAQSVFEEEALRKLQALARSMGSSQASKQYLVNEVLNWYNAVVLQSLYDRDENLRARALIDGQINFTYNDIPLEVDYGLPAANYITATGADAYDQPGSTFWQDNATALGLLGYSVRSVLMNGRTWLALVNNPENLMQVLSGDGDIMNVRKYQNANTDMTSQDRRDAISIYVYSAEYEERGIGSQPGVVKPFIEDGEILYVGNNVSRAYQFGVGSQPDPRLENSLGYHHIAPTTEGDGQPGRWGRIYIPEDQPHSIRAQAKENSLPVRTDIVNGRAKTVTLKTDLS